MKLNSIIVKATWDDQAKVWFAESTGILGLATEAATLEELRTKVLAIVPERIELNGVDSDLREIPVHIMAQQCDKVANPCFS